MRFSEFNIKEYTDPVGLPPERVPGKPWVAKSALDKDQDIGDISHQQKPAYQRKGVNPPVLTKPKVNLADPKQKAEYLNRINQPQQKDWGTISPGKQPQPTMSLANDPVGQATAGEPSLNKTQPPAVWKNQRTGQSSTSPVSTTQTPAKPPVPSTAQTPTTQAKPTISTTAPATSTLSQVGNTLGNIRKGMGKGSEYTNVYAPTGPTSFMNQQYVKDLEKEFAKTPNDPNIRAELNKMRAPGIVAAKGTGTSGGRTTDINDPRLVTSIQPGSDAIRGTGRGPGMANDPRNLTNNPNALGDKETIVPKQPATSSASPATAAKPTVPTGTSTPAQPTTSNYKGSTGSQTIQQLNPNIKDVNKIYAGDTIKLPGGGSYTVKQGDTLDNIAKQSGTTTNTQNDNSIETSKQAEKLKALAQEPISAPKVIPDEEPKDDNSIKNDPSSVQAESESLNRIKSLAGLK